MTSLFNQVIEEWCVILFCCFRCKGIWYVNVVGNWSSNELMFFFLIWFLVMTVSGKSKPEICPLPVRLRWALLPKDELIVSVLASSVKLASRRRCSFCNYRLLKGFISYRNLFDFLLRLVVLKRPGMPIYTSIIQFYAVYFWIRDNQCYSNTFLREPNPWYTVVFHMCRSETITVSRK